MRTLLLLLICFGFLNTVSIAQELFKPGIEGITKVVTSFDSLYFQKASVLRKSGTLFTYNDTVRLLHVLDFSDRVGCEDSLCFKIVFMNNQQLLVLNSEMMRAPFSVSFFSVDSLAQGSKELPRLEKWKPNKDNPFYRPAAQGTHLRTFEMDRWSDETVFFREDLKANYLYVAMYSHYTWVHGYVKW